MGIERSCQAITALLTSRSSKCDNERIGRGTRKMKEIVVVAGLRKLILEPNGFYRAIIRRASELTLKKGEAGSEKRSGKSSGKCSGKRSGKSSEKSSVKRSEKVTEIMSEEVSVKMSEKTYDHISGFCDCPENRPMLPKNYTENHFSPVKGGYRPT